MIRRAVAALVVGAATALFLGQTGSILLPDTPSFASGGSCWSSAVACGAGAVGGLAGVYAIAIGAAALLAASIAHLPARRLLVGFVSPPLWYLGVASADGLGGLAVANLSRRRLRFAFPLVALFHLEAAFVLLAWRILCRHPFAGLAAGVAATFAQGVIALATDQAWTFQVRYLLPGVVLWMLASEWGSPARVRPGRKDGVPAPSSAPGMTFSDVPGPALLDSLACHAEHFPDLAVGELLPSQSGDRFGHRLAQLLFDRDQMVQLLRVIHGDSASERANQALARACDVGRLAVSIGGQAGLAFRRHLDRHVAERCRNEFEVIGLHDRRQKPLRLRSKERLDIRDHPARRCVVETANLVRSLTVCAYENRGELRHRETSIVEPRHVRGRTWPDRGARSGGTHRAARRAEGVALAGMSTSRSLIGRPRCVLAGTPEGFLVRA